MQKFHIFKLDETVKLPDGSLAIIKKFSKVAPDVVRVQTDLNDNDPDKWMPINISKLTPLI